MRSFRHWEAVEWKSIARDTRLKRDVAIKVLPDAFSQDAERLARFQREAEVLATLSGTIAPGLPGRQMDRLQLG